MVANCGKLFVANAISMRFYKSKQKKEIIKSTIPKAWNKILTEPDEDLVELVAEMTERLSGYKPDDSTVADFLSGTSFALSEPYTPISLQISQTTVRSSKKIKETTGLEDFANTSVESFTFRGSEHAVKYWKDVLIGICLIMLDKHREQFPQVLSLVGRKRPYFTREPEELRVAERIDKTDIFVEINISANSIVRLSRKIVTLFGYQKKDLSFYFKSKKNEASSYTA